MVVPVFNERENLPQLLDEIDSALLADEMERYRPYEILFIEDESSDGTARWIDEAAQSNASIQAIHLRRSWGQSAALAAGFEAAEGDVIVPMDGDLQNDPADIPRLLERLEEGYDCVSGWRKDRNDPWHKTIPSAIQTRLAKATGPDINDFGCTLTAYRREAAEEIDLRGERHRYIPAQLHELGYDVDEVEVNHRERTAGESRYGVGRLIRGFVDLLYHAFAGKYRARPMHFFGALGLVLFALGFGLGAWLLVENYFLGASLMPNLPQLILSVTLSLFGFGLFALGFVAELLMEIRYRDESTYRVERVVE